MKEYEFEVLRADKTAPSGWVYPLHILQEAVACIQEAVKNRTFTVRYGPNPTVAVLKTDDVVGIVTEAHMDGDMLKAKIEVLDTLPPDAKKALDAEELRLVTSGMGMVDAEHRVYDFTLAQLMLVPKEKV